MARNPTAALPVVTFRLQLVSNCHVVVRVMKPCTVFKDSRMWAEGLTPVIRERSVLISANHPGVSGDLGCETPASGCPNLVHQERNRPFESARRG
jgi:hypothetical protein